MILPVREILFATRRKKRVRGTKREERKEISDGDSKNIRDMWEEATTIQFKPILSIMASKGEKA